MITPNFYRQWVNFDSEADRSNFDCGNCFMINPKGLTRDLGPFEKNLKCCTFHPFLPAFTVGALIAQKNSVIENYLSKSRLSPLGAFPRESGTSICQTGKIRSTACVFLSVDGGARCTIRDYRPSTCAGYACRSSRGADGLKAWREWEEKVKEFEWTLAHLTAFELGRTLDDVDQEFKSVEIAKSYFARAFAVAVTLRMSDEL